MVIGSVTNYTDWNMGIMKLILELQLYEDHFKTAHVAFILYLTKSNNKYSD